VLLRSHSGLLLAITAVSLGLFALHDSRSGVSFAADSHAISQDDLLLFEVHVDRTMVTDGLTTYRINHKMFLPLGELCRVLTIGISVDAASASAEGFIIDEKRTFSLDAKNRRIRRSGSDEVIAADQILLREDDIYVESELLSKWLPLDLSFDTGGLIINVSPRETLPLQAKLQREKIGNAQDDSDTDGASLRNFDTPYDWLDRPFLDQTIESDMSRSSDGKTSTVQKYATAAAGDLLGLQSNLYLSGTNQNPWSEHRLTMGRNDPDAHLLGPLHARAFSVGAVTLPGLSYVAYTNRLGTGGLVSNRPLTKPTQFDKQSFSGVLLPGWDVELYQNGLPIRHQQASGDGGDGRYHFDDIPLLFGSNDFRLVFHGPQGQQKEEHHRFMLEDSLVQPGEFYYSLGAGRMSDGSYRTIAQFDKSILSNLSITGGFSSLPFNDRSLRYYNLGIRSYIDFLFLSADAITSPDGGRVGALGVRTAIGGVSISATQAFMSNFISEVFSSSADPTVMQSTLRLDSFLPTPLRLPVTLELKRNALLSGQKEYDVNGKISSYLYGLSVTNTVQYQLQGPYSLLSDALQVGRRIRGVGLRGGVLYNIQPTPGLASIDLNAETALGSQYTLTESIISEFSTRKTRFETGLNKGIGLFGFGINAGRSTIGEAFAGVRLNVALGVEPRRLAVLASAEPMTDSGALSARVFIDKNSNGKFDEGEPPVQNVAFRVDGGQTESKTDDQGMLFLHHLSSRQRVNVSLDPASIDDPQLTPVLRGVRMLPRPGKVAQIDFPLRLTTEIDGTLFRYDLGKRTPASDVEIELVDDKGLVVSSTKSAYDGYYILSAVPAGNFDLRVAPAQAERLKLPFSTLKKVRVLPNSNFINGMDSTLALPPLAKKKVDPKAMKVSLLYSKKHTLSRPGHLFFVVVGAFADASNKTKINSLLVSEHLNFKAETVSKLIPVYRVKIAVPGANDKSLAETQKLLTDYGYATSTQNGNGTSALFAGPYYSLKEAQQERAIISAAFPSSTLETSQEVAPLDRFSIGGFAWFERAQEIQARMMDTGLIDESLIIQMRVKPSDFYGQGRFD
jgi:hypothetical protein